MTEAPDLSALELPAVLAWRPYPPLNLPQTRSQLGGLPLLASPDNWPRAEDGTPLHFLARIDCRDLPRERGGLPGEGLLQFFACIDATMCWSGDETSGVIRVLFTLDPGEPTPPPPDLPPIMEGYNDWDRNFRLPEEAQKTVYPHWPLAFGAVKTYPMSEGDVMGGPRLDDLERVSGLAPFDGKLPAWANDDERLQLPPHGPDVPAFPQVWVFCERIARHLASAAIKWRASLSKRKPAADPQEVTDRHAQNATAERLEQTARSWIARAAAAGLDKPVGAADAEAFVAWLSEVASLPRNMGRLSLCGFNGALRRGLESAIRYCGGHPAAAALVPPELSRQLGEDHALVRMGEFLGKPRIEKVAYHQMLGYFLASQDIGPNENEVLLLQLVSDYGVGFMFCDVGEIHFWIDKADLAARRFDRVRANTQGG
jgi:Domain of unknown function (DUF1963)